MNLQKTGKFIQEMRNKANMSQKELGQYLSVTDKAVSKWERGLSCPDVDNLKNMALLFNKTLSEIIYGTEKDARYSSNFPFDIKKEIMNRNYNCDVTVDFDFDSTKYISPFLFGDNLEHTRACVNGGISAQMLKNRKFVGKPGRYGCALDWFRIGNQSHLTFGNSYTCHYEGYKMNRAHECNAQVVTNYQNNTTAGIGQKNIFLRANEKYDFGIVAKAFEDTTVTVRLVSSLGVIYCQHQFLLRSGDFSSYQTVLIPDTSDADAVLEIFFTTQGTIYIGAISLMPTNNFRGMRPDVIEKMKEIGIKLLRWPGGNFAGEYSWKDGLLPRDKRAPFQSYLGLETQPHTHGYDFHEINTDDFVALCREIGAEPFITINPAWDTPEESAQWVEYCNGSKDTPYGALRAKNGHSEPYNVQFWSLGNEFGYGHMEGPNSPTEYSKIARSHASEMLRISPTLTLCSSGIYPREEWVNYSAKVLKDIVPNVSLHHYASPYPEYIDSKKRKEEYYTYIDKVYTEYLPRIQMLRTMLRDDDIKISFDEWNAWYAWYRGGSVTEGIFAASFLNMMFMNADQYGVALCCHFESVNEGAIQVHPDTVSLTPTGQVFSIMKHHANGKVCALQDDVIATLKEDVLNCTFINRTFDKNKTFYFSNPGIITNATLYFSDDVVPNTVFEQSTLPLESDMVLQKIVLPKHSIAHIQIKLS